MLGVISLQDGSPQASVDLFRRSLALNDKNPDAHMNLGTALMGLGQTEEGLTAFHRAVEIRPRHAQSHYNLGIGLAQAERFDEARRALATSVRLEPRNPDALMSLGAALMRLGRADEGLKQLRRAVSIVPDAVAVRLQLCSALIDLRRLEEAEKELRKIKAPTAQSAEVAYVFGQLRERQDRPQSAAKHFREVVTADPENAAAHVSLGIALQRLGRLDDAENHIRRALELTPGMPELQDRLGLILEAAGREDEAAECFRHAGELGHLADMYRRRGDFDQALGVIDELRTANPDDPNIYALLAQIGRYRFTDADRQHAETLAAAGTGDPYEIADLHFALGHCYEADDKIDIAFDHFRRANELLNAKQNYNMRAEERWVETMIETFTPDLFRRLSGVGSDSKLPVLVLGMPRSGTSLVEQIIASHPLAAGAGELNHLAVIEHELPGFLDGTEPFPHGVERIDEGLARRLSGDYLERLTAVAPEAVRVVDKMPGNFRRLGLIALLLPGAFVIHCTRDPVDTCLSLFQRRFRGRHPYAYSLARLGHYYRLYRKLMAHWQAVLPMEMHEVRYEKMIAAPEDESRSLIAFLGLDWDDRCLAFHKTERSVHTASAWQVRQPLYNTAVGRGRNYDPFIGELKQALADANS